ncbi:MAG: hypothetical protein JST44_26700 [Cyanobacteria bacterium SZAS LIN-5]|nr:hypothetical protein [Cyanobacteria bacterium SZAS LIN-5]
MSIKKKLIGSLLLCSAGTILATAAEESKKDPAVGNLNASLGSIGQCVVVTVSSTGGKTQEYHAKSQAINILRTATIRP